MAKRKLGKIKHMDPYEEAELQKSLYGKRKTPIPTKVIGREQPIGMPVHLKEGSADAKKFEALAREQEERKTVVPPPATPPPDVFDSIRTPPEEDIARFEKDMTMLSGQKDAVRATEGIAPAIERVRDASRRLPSEPPLPPEMQEIAAGEGDLFARQAQKSLAERMKERAVAGYREFKEKAPLRAGEIGRGLPGEAKRRFTETMRGGAPEATDRDSIARRYGGYTGPSVTKLESDEERYRLAKDKEAGLGSLIANADKLKNTVEDTESKIRKKNNVIEEAEKDLANAVAQGDVEKQNRIKANITELEREKERIAKERDEAIDAKSRVDAEISTIQRDSRAADINSERVRREREEFEQAYQKGYKEFKRTTGWRGAERAVSKELAERGTWLTKFSGERLDTGKMRSITDVLASPVGSAEKMGERWSGIFGKRTAGYPTTSVTDLVSAGGYIRGREQKGLDYLGEQVALGRRTSSVFGMPHAPPGGGMSFSMTTPVKGIRLGDIKAIDVEVEKRPRASIYEISGEPRQQRVRIKGSGVYARVRLPMFSKSYGHGKIAAGKSFVGKLKFADAMGKMSGEQAVGKISVGKSMGSVSVGKAGASGFSLGKASVGIAPAKFEKASIAQCKGTVIDMKNIAKGVDLSTIGKKKRRGKK